MKKNIKNFLKLVLISLFLPFFSYANTYTLSNGEQFEGTEAEYKYAELILSVEPKIPDLFGQAWEKTSKKYKFPTLEKIISGAKFSGDAGYDPVKKEFYLSNSNGPGRIILFVKHELSRKKLSELLVNNAKEIGKLLEKLQKESKVKSLKIAKDSDLDYINSAFYDKFYDVGVKLGEALAKTFVLIEGSTNKTTPQPVLMATTLAKGGFLEFSEETPRENYYFDLNNTFSEELFFEERPEIYKSYYLVFEIDSAAAANTKVNFKLQDLRALSRIKASDVLFDQ